MVKDLDEMEHLGLYEVAPEDFFHLQNLFASLNKAPSQELLGKG